MAHEIFLFGKFPFWFFKSSSYNSYKVNQYVFKSEPGVLRHPKNGVQSKDLDRLIILELAN